jgi:hypothetical protein
MLEQVHAKELFRVISFLSQMFLKNLKCGFMGMNFILPFMTAITSAYIFINVSDSTSAI